MHSHDFLIRKFNFSMTALGRLLNHQCLKLNIIQCAFKFGRLCIEIGSEWSRNVMFHLLQCSMDRSLKLFSLFSTSLKRCDVSFCNCSSANSTCDFFHLVPEILLSRTGNCSGNNALQSSIFCSWWLIIGPSQGSTINGSGCKLPTCSTLEGFGPAKTGLVSWMFLGGRNFTMRGWPLKVKKCYAGWLDAPTIQDLGPAAFNGLMLHWDHCKSVSAEYP